MASTAHFPDPVCFQQQSNEFISWLTGKPGVRMNSKIRLTDLTSLNAGRGVVAQTDIPEGEELFAIPRGLILSVQNSKLSEVLAQNLQELGPWMSLMLVMIYEYLSGEQSVWSSYFKVLPKEFDTLMWWSESELRELQGSAVVEKIGKQGADESILEMITPIVRANPALFPPIDGLPSFDGDAGTQAILRLGHIMGSLILAYAFDIGKPEDDDGDEEGEDGYATDEEEEQASKGMVPLADLLNADGEKHNARLYQEEEFFIMKTTKPIQAGEEILNEHGETPRADLLRRYGFVTDNYAQYDVVELSLSTICQAAGLDNADVETQPPLQFLEDLELLDDGYIIPRLSSEHPLPDMLPEELLILLKTLSLSPEQLKHQMSKNKPPKPVGQAELAILQKAVQLKGAQYATNIQQDQEFLAQLTPSDAVGPLEESPRRLMMAIMVRIGEKEILQDLATILDRVLAESAQNGDSGSAVKRSANGDQDDSRKKKSQRT